MPVPISSHHLCALYFVCKDTVELPCKNSSYRPLFAAAAPPYQRCSAAFSPVYVCTGMRVCVRKHTQRHKISPVESSTSSEKVLVQVYLVHTHIHINTKLVQFSPVILHQRVLVPIYLAIQSSADKRESKAQIR
eukprot:GHVU01081286.1.p1 GENE.GHVU01081286.1~~GHVU01081286.1.p1  ORF type:complete len:134 (-),score=4.36 GHVU01081286.1:171-572(-)